MNARLPPSSACRRRARRRRRLLLGLLVAFATVALGAGFEVRHPTTASSLMASGG